MSEDTDDRQFVALIGDIRGSRELDDRSGVQEEFEQVVASLSDRVSSDSIASQFTVTTGDEFQVLLTDVTDAIDAAVAASDRFHPVGLRFGIGTGTLDTAINPDQTIGMDGPCFHRARDAIKAAQKEGAWIRVAGWSPAVDDHVNTMVDLVQCVREDWTDRQAQFARALSEEDTQTAVADRYDVAKSTVSESIDAGHVQEVRAVERSLGTVLRCSSDGETP
ncbi:SatD family protein [Halococcoides cellulosivorans]|uniref:Uncharacterized protein n=1 Tax=Halococcoides cellulosivorans TaxID=1679096 RepID=A0A2R4WZE3_9EURY|nr:SatD family protein [Halococcoides cellulosivorans]AWB26909.1 hypothetical protein HARCEL1_03860 [Halococcoides cellulosivorans]